jgi:hypothetical protein
MQRAARLPHAVSVSQSQLALPPVSRPWKIVCARPARVLKGRRSRPESGPVDRNGPGRIRTRQRRHGRLPLASGPCATISTTAPATLVSCALSVRAAQAVRRRRPECPPCARAPPAAPQAAASVWRVPAVSEPVSDEHMPMTREGVVNAGTRSAEAEHLLERQPPMGRGQFRRATDGHERHEPRRWRDIQELSEALAGHDRRARPAGRIAHGMG